MPRMTDKGGRDEPRPTRLEAVLDLPPDSFTLASSFAEVERVWAAIDELRDPRRSYLRLFDPLGYAGLEWRLGRLTKRRSAAERMALRMALRRADNFAELAKDVWLCFLYDDTSTVDLFLEGCMSLYPSGKPGEQRTKDVLRKALFGVLSRQWADRAARLNRVDPKPWLDPASPNPKGHLYVTVARDAHKLWVERAKAESAGTEREAPHKPLDELTPREARIHASEEEEFAAKESVREQVEERIAKHELSAREAEVARLVAQDKNTAEIGAELGIAVETVRVHRKNIRDKAERADAC